MVGARIPRPLGRLRISLMSSISLLGSRSKVLGAPCRLSPPPLPPPPGLQGSSAFLSLRAVSNHPERPFRCSRVSLHGRLQASSNLENWPPPLCVTRPNRVHRSYGSQVRLPGLRLGDYSFQRQVGYMLDTQLACCLRFKTRGKPGFAWRTRWAQMNGNR